jgi:hypothetical protein
MYDQFSLALLLSTFESNWRLETNKWECKRMFKYGVGKLIDGSWKRIDGIRTLVGRAVNACNNLLNALPSLVRSGGEFRQGIFPTISFRRNGWLRRVYFILCKIISSLSNAIKDFFYPSSLCRLSDLMACL